MSSVAFLDRLREKNSLSCTHPHASFRPVSSPDGTDEWIWCAECEKHVLSVRQFLCRDCPPLESPTLAREYAEWTGRVDVPCRLDLAPLRDRVLPGVLQTRYGVLHRGYRLLRALHSPFAAVRGLEEDGGGPDPKLFRHLMTEYLGLIDRVSSSDADSAENGGGGEDRKREANMIRTLLTNMKNVFADVDMHDQYFNVLVPYVKLVRDRRAGRETPEEEIWAAEGSDRPFGPALERELLRSAYLHRHFSRHCIPFEVLHVMVLCYLCGDDADAVYNLVLDMTAKLCSRFYSFPVSRLFPIGLKIRQCLDKNIVPSKNLKLYYFLQKFKKGGENLDEYFSEELLREYGALETEIHRHAPVDENDKLGKFIYQQIFPYVLFEDREGEEDAGYYAFVMALAHYVSRTRFGNAANAATLGASQRTNPLSVPKGVVAECRKIYRFVRKCIARVREFDGGETAVDKVRSMYWTKDMFHLFLTSNSDLGNDLADVLKMLMVTERD